MTDIVYEDVRKFIVISRSALPRIGNVSDQKCRENQNTHFMFSSIFPKIIPFFR
jgi:hypothetical protein